MDLLHRVKAPRTTRAAEGLDRRAFTVDEVLRMQEIGILDEDEGFELATDRFAENVASGPLPIRLTDRTDQNTALKSSKLENKILV